MAREIKAGDEVRARVRELHAAGQLEAWPCTSATYEIEQVLGSGTFGTVVSAERQSRWEPKHRVALKLVPRAHKSGEDDGCSGWASRELQLMLIMRRKPHPGVIGLDEFFYCRVNGSLVLCMVMPLHLGSLRGWLDECSIERSSLRPAVERLVHAREGGKQLAEALTHVHALGIVHRDLKPENILLQPSPPSSVLQHIIADLGSAKLLIPPGATRIGFPTPVSTPLVSSLQYRAPELLFGSQQYGFSVDLWALGCIMGDILLGSSRRLFDVPWADDEQATKPSVQVEMLLLAMGPPSIEALRAMMIDEHLPPSFSSWLHLRPKASSIYCWRKRLVTALIDGDMSLAHCFPTKGPADHRLRAEAIVQFIQLMLNFNPKDRPTAYELSRMTHVRVRFTCWGLVLLSLYVYYYIVITVFIYILHV